MPGPSETCVFALISSAGPLSQHRWTVDLNRVEIIICVEIIIIPILLLEDFSSTSPW